MILPEIAIASVVLSLGVVATLTRRTGQSLPTRLLVATCGAVVGAAMVLFGADPTVLALRVLPWSSSLAYYVLSAVVALVVLWVGVVVAVGRLRRSTSRCDRHTSTPATITTATIASTTPAVTRPVQPAARDGGRDGWRQPAESAATSA